jgi:hypothetical protein
VLTKDEGDENVVGKIIAVKHFDEREEEVRTDGK